MAVVFVNDSSAVRTTNGNSLVICVPVCITCGNILILGASTYTASNEYAEQCGWTTLSKKRSIVNTNHYLAWRKACSEPCSYTLQLLNTESDANWTAWIGQFSGADVCCGPLGLSDAQHTCYVCNSEDPNTPSTLTACCSGDHYALSYWQAAESFGIDITSVASPCGYTLLEDIRSIGSFTDVFWSVAGKAFTGTVDDAGAWNTNGTNDYYNLGALLIIEAPTSITGNLYSNISGWGQLV